MYVNTIMIYYVKCVYMCVSVCVCVFVTHVPTAFLFSVHQLHMNLQTQCAYGTNTMGYLHLFQNNL